MQQLSKGLLSPVSPVRVRLALFLQHISYFRGHSSTGRAPKSLIRFWHSIGILSKILAATFIRFSVQIRMAPILHIFTDYFYGAVAQLGRAVLKGALTKALTAIFFQGNTGCRFESCQLQFKVGNFLEGGN